MIFYIKDKYKVFEIHNENKELFFIVKRESNFYAATYEGVFNDKKLILKIEGLFVDKYSVLKNETSNTVCFFNNTEKLVFNDSIIEVKKKKFFLWKFNWYWAFEILINKKIICKSKISSSFDGYLYKVEFYENLENFDYYKIVLYYICLLYVPSSPNS
jgi:hypothetical protein